MFFARLVILIERSDQTLGREDLLHSFRGREGEHGHAFALPLDPDVRLLEHLGRHHIGRIDLRPTRGIRHPVPTYLLQREPLGRQRLRFGRIHAAFDQLCKPSFVGPIRKGGEERLGSPFLRGGQLADAVQKAFRHGIYRRQEHPIHSAESRYVVIGPMGGDRSAEGTDQVYQTMALHPRQRDARELERVYPGILQERIARWMLGGEIPIEFRIVGHHLRVSRESYEPCQGLLG